MFTFGSETNIKSCRSSNRKMEGPKKKDGMIEAEDGVMQEIGNPSPET